ncbi:small GTP-binding domain protein (macronuclear) [Tetrahymena thermophila SB210]|uniref:Small GTP-binding domain protein n=1 Tax=Tetrahymena thermophila (strain SB210) TaxID=312017 RepID=I7MI28_TETTS|nr:small GTP-binding domain protein [Tetrahymena thermophila SB210]EAS03845.2 small GTP-binding domain protein [Tetrahymena thermophila SB210]|eukprot:XP_001024090.2 small GTP-binding domain protein [Tetrahymena thermophila SB210]
MFKQFDIFGSQINLRFNGQQTHKTNLGSLISIIIAVFIIYRLFNIIYSVVQRKNPQVMYNERQVDDPALFSIDSKYFPIAFAMEDPQTNNYYMDESIYTIKAQWKSKVEVFNSTTQEYDIVWQVQDIDVKRCTLENFQNLDNQKYYLKLNYTNMYCLPPDYNIKIQGDFPSPVFSQLIITIQKCQTNCNTQQLIDYYLKKAYLGMLISDAYVDPTIKDYPFKIYSRDLFWSTSSKMPKDVNIYIRNNYVQSDFGWFFSDIKTQTFPTFSYYEDSVYPEDFQDYFLQIYFRFEKQKESLYLRNYPDFNSIITQIGGFTQSLLAIGYLICRRFSQLRLNQDIVNQIFKYEDEEQKFQKDDVIIEQEIKAEVIPKKQIKQLGNRPQSTQNIVIKRKQRNLTQIIQTNKKNIYESNHSLNQDLDKSKIKNIVDDQNSSFPIKNNCKLKTGGFSEYSKQCIDLINCSEMLKQQSEQKDQKQMLNQLLQNDFPSEVNITNPNSMGIIKSTLPQKVLKKQPTQKQLKKAVENHFDSMFKQQTKSIHVTIWEYIKSSLFPCKQQKKKKDIINYSFEMLYQNLDILQILKRLIEVEKLKRLFLNEEQLKLFDYLPKPTINSGLFDRKKTDKGIQNQYEISLLYQDNRTELQRAKDAYDSYKKILNKSESTELDEKLINMLDQNLIDIFEAQNESNSALMNLVDINNELNQVSILQDKSQTKYINQNIDQKSSVKSKNQSHNSIQQSEQKIDKLISYQLQQLNLSNFCNLSQKKDITLNEDQPIQTETTNQEEVAQERMYCRQIPFQLCNLNIGSK